MKKHYIIAAACCAALLIGTLVFGYIAMKMSRTGDNSPSTEVTRPPATPPAEPLSVSAETAVVIVDKPTPTTPGNCVVGGCSSQLCVDSKTSGNVVSTCEYRASYACYQAKSARCERQANGQCGWTQTPALVQCLKENEGAAPVQ